MSNTGQPMRNHKVDKGGGYLPTKGHPVEISQLTVANPGELTVSLRSPFLRALKEQGFQLKAGGGPWTCTIAGVTGADAANINGTRTLTRTGALTATIGVNTTAMVFDISAATVTGLEFEETDANFPSEEVLDFSG